MNINSYKVNCLLDETIKTVSIVNDCLVSISSILDKLDSFIQFQISEYEKDSQPHKDEEETE